MTSNHLDSAVRYVFKTKDQKRLNKRDGFIQLSRKFVNI